MTGHEHTRHHGTKGHASTDRKIDATGGNDEGGAEGHSANGSGLQQDVGDDPQTKVVHGEHEEDENHDQSCKDEQLLERGPQEMQDLRLLG